MAFEAESTTATFSLALRGCSTGDHDVLLRWAIERPILYETQHLLAAGDNTITSSVPSALYQAVILYPPEDTDDTWALKGNAGDTGVILGTTIGPVVVPGVTTASTFILNATTGGYTIQIRWVR